MFAPPVTQTCFLNVFADAGAVDECLRANVKPNVQLSPAAFSKIEKYQIARCQPVDIGNAPTGIDLLIGSARQIEAMLGIGPFHES